MKQRLNFEPRWLTITIFFIAGIFAGCFILFIFVFSGGSVYGIQKVQSSLNSNYKLINPLLTYDSESQQSHFFQNLALEQNINKLISARKDTKEISDASVYFRDLEQNRWIGINEEQKFSPGKLLKIPIMIAYYKTAESDPKIMEKKFIYKLSAPNPNHDSTLVVGNSYTPEEMIQQMIITDDDNAGNILYDNIDKATLNEVYTDLGIDFHEDSKTTDDFLSTKMYSLFFRVLYNSTYLNREHSEHALEILSQTPDNGFAAGLPNNVSIAHKFRMRITPVNAANEHETHDCGIVYYPGHPYLLCAMVVGRSKEAAVNLFEDIGTAVYQDMVATYK